MWISIMPCLPDDESDGAETADRNSNIGKTHGSKRHVESLRNILPHEFCDRNRRPGHGDR